MPIMSLQQLRHPDTESDMKHLAPSAEEISKLGITCSNCGAREGTGKTLMVCSKCRDARYCSRACQVAGWRTHKHVCRSDGQAHSKLPVALKLSKVLAGNQNLMFLIKLAAVLSLDLLKTPSNALKYVLRVRVTTGPEDFMAFFKAKMSRIEDAIRQESMKVILQLVKFEKEPIEGVSEPLKKMLEKKRQEESLGVNKGLPVVLFFFSLEEKSNEDAEADGGEQKKGNTAMTDTISYAAVISPDVLDHARRKEPFQIKSAISGQMEVPLNEESIVDTLNMTIRADKSNQLMLRGRNDAS